MNMKTMDSFFLKQIEDVLNDFSRMRGRSNYSDLSDAELKDLSSFNVRASALIERAAFGNPAYIRHAKEAQDIFSTPNSCAVSLAGILMSLRADIESGYIQTASEIVRADLFSDYLEMADYLAVEGFKDPAAVITGSTLEVHLKKLAENAGLAVVSPSGKPKKASLINDELAKTAYDKLNQKNVAAWLDLRNKAAHGEYDKYSLDEVKLMIQGVRLFMTAFPA